jgi:hypothetical protein
MIIRFDGKTVVVERSWNGFGPVHLLHWVHLCSAAVYLMRSSAPSRQSQVRPRLAAGAKEIRTLRPPLNASVPRGATWVPRTAPGFGVAPPSS